MPTPAVTRRGMLVVLHPIFALTGVGCAITGALLPALAGAFHLADNQSGLLLFWIYAGMASGALLCRGNYARIIAGGLVALALACVGFTIAPAPLFFPVAFFYGAAVSAPMTAVSLFAGRNYPALRATTLSALNFTWSLGATLAPLFVARTIELLNWRAVYGLLAVASLISAMAAQLALRDSQETARTTPETTGIRNVRMVVLFAVFFFLEVGMECTAGAWASSYVLRFTHTSVALAAAASSVFWGGFLTGRGISPLVLLRMRPARLLQSSLLAALGAATLMLVSRGAVPILVALLVLGLALAPVFPVALAAFFERARQSSDSRFVLAFSGFGGAVFPWIAGAVSSRSGSLRAGLLTLPICFLLMNGMLPLLGISRARVAPEAGLPESERSGEAIG